MKVIVLTGYDDNITELGEATDWSKREYAKLHSYDFHAERHFPEGAHPSWWKLSNIRHAAREYDIVLWLDSDTVVTNPTIPVGQFADPAFVLIVSEDWCAPSGYNPNTPFISMGNCVIMRRPDTEQFWLDAEQHVQYKNHPCWDQEAVMLQMRRNKDYDRKVKRLPRRTLNAVPPEVQNVQEPWNEGDFLCHLTGLGAHSLRVPFVPRYNEAFQRWLDKIPPPV